MIHNLNAQIYLSAVLLPCLLFAVVGPAAAQDNANPLAADVRTAIEKKLPAC